MYPSLTPKLILSVLQILKQHMKLQILEEKKLFPLYTLNNVFICEKDLL